LLDEQAVELARANTDDLAGVLDLMRQCALLESGIAESIDSFIVARSAGALVGCAGLETYGGLGLLRSVAVSESARGHGLGTKLVGAVAALARSRGLHQLFLLTTTAPGFFERQGFLAVARSAVPAPIAQSWEFSVGCSQTALVMRCELMELRA